MKAKISTLFGALIWILFVLLIYYWIHKPLTPILARQLGGAILDLTLTFVFISLSGGLGRKFLSTWQEELHPAEYLASTALIGLGALSLSILLIGMINLSLLSVAAILLAILGLNWRETRAWLQDFYLWGKQLDRYSGISLFIGINIFMAFIMAAAPPTAFDSLTYQLVGPKLWVAEGHFSALPHNHFFGFPQLANTLYAGQIAILNGRLTSAAILHACLAVLWLMLIGGYAARRFNAPSSRFAPAILLTATSIWLHMGWPYVDLFTGAYGMLAWIALDHWLNTQKQSALILLGVACGLAMSIKYNAVILGGGIAFYMLLNNRRNVLAIAQMVLIASLVLAPWLIRNFVFYDNPTYPFGFTTGEWDDLSNTWYTNAGNANLQKNPALVLPILISPTFIGVEGTVIWSATIGALFLLFIPLLTMTWGFLPSEWRIPIRRLLGLVLIFHLIWLIQSGISDYGSQTRLMYPMFGWLAVLAGVSLASFEFYPQKPLYLGWILQNIFALVLILTTLNHIAGTRPAEDAETLTGTTTFSHLVETRAVDYLFGVISEEDYLNHNMGWHIEAMRQVNTLPDESQILFLWETRSLYCDEPRLTCIEDTILMRWWRDRRLAEDTNTVLADWKAQGVTHILVWETGREFEFNDNRRLTEADKTSFDELITLLEPIWHGEDIYTLYLIP